MLFKSKKTGETIALREYIKELHHEIKENAIKMLNRKNKRIQKYHKYITTIKSYNWKSC